MLPLHCSLFVPCSPSPEPAPLSAAELQRCFNQRFELREAGASDRDELQAFIRHCFDVAHGARIAHFMPRLFSLHERNGGRIAAFGLRAAGCESLFLESYLDMPIEAQLHARFGKVVRREDIVEVGNLSATHAGATRWLIVAISLLLRQEGYRWIAFTATSVVRNALQRLGLTPHELGSATLARLPVELQGDWGDYYQQSPAVMTGDLDYGFKTLFADEGPVRHLRATRATTVARRMP
jgi:hypothetical protein